jgi:hypothetical protein
LATTPTGRGFARDDVANLLGRDEQPLPPGVTRLTAAVLAGLLGWWRRPAFNAKAVGGGRQRGIAGIGVEFGGGVSELLLEQMELILVLGERGECSVEFDLEAAVGGLQFSNAQLGISLLQLNNAPAEGTQVKAYILGHLGQRFLSDHADR